MQRRGNCGYERTSRHWAAGLKEGAGTKSDNGGIVGVKGHPGIGLPD